MFQHFYYEILRKTIYAFGTLFNNIYIKHKNDEGEVVSTIKVPISYGPTQKFLARLEQSPDLNKPIQITLPRMSMEIINLSYNSANKATTTTTFLVKDKNNTVRKSYLPVPYTLNLELSIFTKLEDDMFQIVEQILPYFQPSYAVTIKYIDETNEKRDVYFNLDNISMTDDYEGNFEKRRSLIWTLKFSADIYFFIPVSSSDEAAKNIIKKVSFGFIAGDYNNTIKNEDLRIFVNPIATKNYTGTVVTIIKKDVTIDDTIIEVESTTNLNNQSFIAIDNETMFIETITDNKIKVLRGVYDTTRALHLLGSNVLNITTIDNNLISPKDPFSFNSVFE
jgi:hypothetical protein